MKIGYACICLGEEECRQRTCTQKYASEVVLKEIIEWNLNALKNILQYNVEHHILLYRLSSSMIPFGSSPINTLNWRVMFKEAFAQIGAYIATYGLRVSMHPGQYTILNALNQDVVMRAIEDLRYHCDVMDLMGLDATHKMILHIGGIYGDKESAMKRFIDVYHHLDEVIKQRLIIENDDRYFTIEDVLYISKQIKIPVVFDNLHHEILPPKHAKTISTWLSLVHDTWREMDGVQKIHYSQQNPLKRVGAHAQSIEINPFLSFLKQLEFDLDIMLEVKDKNISALKIQYLINGKDMMFYCDWTHYRYLFYLHSITQYMKYERLFIGRKKVNRYVFYKLAETYSQRIATKEAYDMLFSFMKQQWYSQLKKTDKNRYDDYVRRFMEGLIEHNTCIEGMMRIAQRSNIQEAVDGLLLFLYV